MRVSCILLAFGLLPGTAAATSLDIDFAFSTMGHTAVLQAARDAGITITEDNFGLYGYTGNGLVLGNDGLLNQASVTADPGMVFDALTADLRSLNGRLTVLSCDGIDSFPDPYFPGFEVSCDDEEAIYFYFDTLAMLAAPVVRKPDLIFQGYRNGPTPVVTAVLAGPASGLVDIAALGDFTALTRLDVSITGTGFDWLFDRAMNAWTVCEGGSSCGLAVIDRLSLDVRSATSPDIAVPVPLPPGFVLSAFGLAGLGLLRGKLPIQPGPASGETGWKHCSGLSMQSDRISG